jgi:hypothetical protein
MLQSQNPLQTNTNATQSCRLIPGTNLGDAPKYTPFEMLMSAAIIPGQNHRKRQRDMVRLETLACVAAMQQQGPQKHQRELTNDLFPIRSRTVPTEYNEPYKYLVHSSTMKHILDVIRAYYPAMSEGELTDLSMRLHPVISFITRIPKSTREICDHLHSFGAAETCLHSVATSIRLPKLGVILLPVLIVRTYITRLVLLTQMVKESMGVDMTRIDLALETDSSLQSQQSKNLLLSAFFGGPAHVLLDVECVRARTECVWLTPKLDEMPAGCDPFWHRTRIQFLCECYHILWPWMDALVGNRGGLRLKNNTHIVPFAVFGHDSSDKETDPQYLPRFVGALNSQGLVAIQQREASNCESRVQRILSRVLARRSATTARYIRCTPMPLVATRAPSGHEHDAGPRKTVPL